MSFDKQPDGDPHGECATEIARLERELATERERADLGWQTAGINDRARIEEMTKRDKLTDQVGEYAVANQRFHEQLAALENEVLPKLTAENAALRQERDAYRAQFDGLCEQLAMVEKERDALAATIFSMTPYCQTSVQTGKPLLPRDIFDILTARDHLTKAEALREAAQVCGKIDTASFGEATRPTPDVCYAELHRMADVIEKEQSNG